MTTRAGAALLMLACLLSALLPGCTGGSETTAAEEEAPPREAPPSVGRADARKSLASLSDVIPVYAGAQYRDDLTRRDEVMIRGHYGEGAEVYTLATDDSFPQVYHYYTTYLAQFRAFPAQDTYPAADKDWRTLEVKLNEAMQDPFIPGATLDIGGKQVILQVAETEAEPRTVIRYIITPSPAPSRAASAGPAPAMALR